MKALAILSLLTLTTQAMAGFSCTLDHNQLNRELDNVVPGLEHGPFDLAQQSYQVEDHQAEVTALLRNNTRFSKQETVVIADFTIDQQIVNALSEEESDASGNEMEQYFAEVLLSRAEDPSMRPLFDLGFSINRVRSVKQYKIGNQEMMSQHEQTTNELELARAEFQQTGISLVEARDGNGNVLGRFAQGDYVLRCR